MSQCSCHRDPLGETDPIPREKRAGFPHSHRTSGPIMLAPRAWATIGSKSPNERADPTEDCPA